MAMKRTVTGADPDKMFPVPTDVQFDGMEYRDAPELAAIGEKLIATAPELGDLAAYPPMIRYVWKQKAKKKQGSTVLGFCNKVSGLAKYYGRCDWTIEVAADAAAEMYAANWQIEALLFHELNHIEVVVDEDTDEATYKVRGEGFYAFGSELRRYGAWMNKLEEAASAFAQVPLFGEAA